MNPARFRFRQIRGLWTAKAIDDTTRLGLAEEIAVLPDHEDGQVDLSSRLFVAAPDEENPEQPFWWARPRRGRFRSLLDNGLPIWVRYGVRSPHTSRRTVKGDKGVWRIESLILTDSEFRFRFAEQVGDVVK